MGEYADYILNGDDCQECGEYISEGDGFPRTCSGCAKQHHNDPSDFMMIRKEDDIEGLYQFLADREYDLIRKKKKDRKGQPMIGLVYAQGRMRGGDKRGLIVCANPHLHKMAVEIVERYRKQV